MSLALVKITLTLIFVFIACSYTTIIICPITCMAVKYTQLWCTMAGYIQDTNRPHDCYLQLGPYVHYSLA